MKITDIYSQHNRQFEGTSKLIVQGFEQNSSVEEQKHLVVAVLHKKIISWFMQVLLKHLKCRLVDVYKIGILRRRVLGKRRHILLKDLAMQIKYLCNFDSLYLNLKWFLYFFCFLDRLCQYILYWNTKIALKYVFQLAVCQLKRQLLSCSFRCCTRYLMLRFS